MASYEQNENREWSVRFRYAEFGQLHQKRLGGYKTKRDAEKAYSDFLLHTNIKSDTQYSNITFENLYNSYLEYAKSRLKISTLYDLTHVINKHILPIFKNMKIYEITKKDIFIWQEKLNQTNYSYNFKRKLRDYLSVVLQYAVFYYDLPINPITQVEPFKRTGVKKEMEIWNKEEFTKFISFVDKEPYKTFFLFLYLTGCRKGEAFALTWNKINFINQTVTIDKNLTRKSPDKPYEIVSTKTNNMRNILLPKTLINSLINLKNQNEIFNETHFVFGEEKPIAEMTTARVFNDAIKKAGVKNLHLHCLRHSHASYLISQGESIVMVSKRLGHSSVQMTLNVYSHLMPNEEEKMVTKLELNI